jgi:hypothetical protein
MPTEILEKPLQQTPNSQEAIDVANMAKVTPEEIESVVRQFSPRAEVDEQGLTRTIFECGDKTFSFIGREETPVYPTIERSLPTYLGHESWWLSHPLNKNAPVKPESERQLLKDMGLSEDQIKTAEDSEAQVWQEEHDRLVGFQDKLASLQESNKTRPEHFVAEESAYGLYSLLARIQPDNPRWQEQAQAVGANQYNQEALLVIDMATAVNAVYTEQKRGADEQPLLGEAVVIAALLGDKAAQQLAETAVKLQDERETQAQLQAQMKMEEYASQLQGVESYKPEDILVVHATNYAPEKRDDGYSVKTTHDATGYPRATVHTALNHKVESHLWGSWDNKDYVLVSGLDEMLAKNGSPNSINGADTWWTRNPGENLDFPNATLIAPGASQAELFTRTEDGQVLYKSNGFTTEDIGKVEELLGQDVKETINEALGTDSDQAISLESEQGQHIIANILRDTLVRKEITDVRGKQLLEQSDDKFMPMDVSQRLNKMAGQLRLSIQGGLHTESKEGYLEGVVGRGERRFAGFADAKSRRTAYASGFMGTGGTSRQRYMAMLGSD